MGAGQANWPRARRSRPGGGAGLAAAAHLMAEPATSMGTAPGDALFGCARASGLQDWLSTHRLL